MIELKVKEIRKKEILCRIINGGKLTSKRGVNIPGVPLKLPALTEKDKEDIFKFLWGLELLVKSRDSRLEDFYF